MVVDWSIKQLQAMIRISATDPWGDIEGIR